MRPDPGAPITAGARGARLPFRHSCNSQKCLNQLWANSPVLSPVRLDPVRTGDGRGRTARAGPVRSGHGHGLVARACRGGAARVSQRARRRLGAGSPAPTAASPIRTTRGRARPWGRVKGVTTGTDEGQRSYRPRGRLRCRKARSAAPAGRAGVSVQRPWEQVGCVSVHVPGRPGTCLGERERAWDRRGRQGCAPAPCGNAARSVSVARGPGTRCTET